MIPPFTLSAVPYPKKNRRMLPGCHPPTAAATAEATVGSAGWALLTAAAALAAFDAVPGSRRDTASAVHINGAANGPSPLPPAPSHDNRFTPKPVTEPEDAAARAAEITDAGAAVATEPACVATGFPPPAEDTPVAGVADVAATVKPDTTEAGKSTALSPADTMVAGAAEAAEAELPALRRDGVSATAAGGTPPERAEPADVAG